MVFIDDDNDDDLEIIKQVEVYRGGPSVGNQWIVFNNNIKVFFSADNEQGARLMANKITYGAMAQIISNRLANAIDEGINLENVYFDRGYNSGGGNDIIDADIESLGITASNLAAFITLVQQLQNFANNQTVTEADYDSTLNIMRTDV